VDENLWDQLDDNGFVSDFAIRNPWIFEDAKWFVFTIASTVGYGNIVPVTTGGYIFTIIYSIPAIISMGYFIKQMANCYNRIPLFHSVT